VADLTTTDETVKVLRVGASRAEIGSANANSNTEKPTTALRVSGALKSFLTLPKL
jgi:hypothetical protein